MNDRFNAILGGVIEWDNLNSEKNYSPIRAYNNSKLAVLLFASELARRLQSKLILSVWQTVMA